ncbi:MAG: hypothetical protein ACREEW_08060 [Caulobacteraceae bacterium]
MALRGKATVTELDEDLAAMARDELERALTLSWPELAPIAPWGDAYDGFSPAGRQVTVERSYLWADGPGGDILCEVVVYGGPSRWEEGARATGVIARGPRCERRRPIDPGAPPR